MTNVSVSTLSLKAEKILSFLPLQLDQFPRLNILPEKLTFWAKGHQVRSSFLASFFVS